MSSSIKNLSYNFLYRLEERLNKKFEHLQNPQIGYFSHFKQAMNLAKTSFLASIVLTIHAFYPDAFETTGTTMLKSSLENINKK